MYNRSRPNIFIEKRQVAVLSKVTGYILFYMWTFHVGTVVYMEKYKNNSITSMFIEPKAINIAFPSLIY
jgi:hypothetical protein